ncbi:MAG: ABC-F family ATP-binding cassette domain-containing protein [Sphingobacteriales bacterium]|nr:MAG: ABC-F family ATP-binding cassette domain-containing protein [Sphingobacteriales bacterium]
MLSLQHIAYAHPNKDVLFTSIDLTLNKQEKIGLIGNNGSGKSTLLKLIAGDLQPAEGYIRCDTQPYYVPQHFGQYNHLTIAEALRVNNKLNALQEILSGLVTADNMTTLDDDWSIAERCAEALSCWGLTELDLSRPMASLSGGQKTKVFLAGILIHKPGLILLDEPSNHLDLAGREQLYSFVQATNAAMLVVSHDRALLNLLNGTAELSRNGITMYGGDYGFYAAQKELALQAQAEDLKDREKALRKARDVEREAMERQQKLDARGKRKQEQAGLPTISMNTLRNNAEKSTARTKDVHAEKVAALASSLHDLRKEMPDKDQMKLDFDDTDLHQGKVLFHAKGINFCYAGEPLWWHGIDLQLNSGDRLVIKGSNGSGKTTLIRLLLDELQPSVGTVSRAFFNAIYIDQDYALVDNGVTVYQQAERYNNSGLQEHEIKSRLTHFLFDRTDWDKQCAALSGGEKMRLILCCLTIKSKAPDMIILDEPTNNLDLRNIGILTAAIKSYQGTLVVVSHDVRFLEEIVVNREFVF